MGEYSRMTIVVPEPMAESIQAAIAAGEYASASEVVRDAMRLWNERRAFRAEELRVLRDAWSRGKASGVGANCVLHGMHAAVMDRGDSSPS